MTTEKDKVLMNWANNAEWLREMIRMAEEPPGPRPPPQETEPPMTGSMFVERR